MATSSIKPRQQGRTLDVKRLVQEMYEAWPAGDLATVERMVSDDFRFSSPYDDEIGRAEFFARCWPNYVSMKAFTFRRIVVDGNAAFVTYDLELRDGHRTQNTEWLSFTDEGKLQRADVYFGAEHQAAAGARPKPSTMTNPGTIEDDAEANGHVDRSPREPHEKRVATAEHAKLMRIVGRWSVTGENAESAPGTGAAKVTGEESYEWLEGGFFILGRWDRRAVGAAGDAASGNESRHTGVSMLGLVPERGSVVTYNADNLGYAREYRVAIDRDGAWKFTGAYERATYTFVPDGSSWVAVWEMSTDGRTWRPLCRLEGRRIGDAA